MFDLPQQERSELWNKLTLAFEKYYSHTEDLKVCPDLNQTEIIAFIENFEFDENYLSKSLDHVLEGLTKYSVHTPHPMYFGLFNPRPSFAGIMADTITAFFNPQIAAWSHAPFAAEAERYLILQFGLRFGYTNEEIEGAFTSGGAEANQKYPEFKEQGWANIDSKPLIYCSSESHHSIQKAAKIIGLGLQSVRVIPADDSLCIDVVILQKQIDKDIKNDFTPLIVITTLGVTGTGVLDDIESITQLKNKYHFGLHADGAYGGAVTLSSQYKYLLSSIEKQILSLLAPPL